MTWPEGKVKNLLVRRDVEWGRVLRVVEVGSTAIGISTKATGDDFDATVVRIESYPELVVGSPKRQSMMIRTQPDGVRSKVGDIDLNVYTLRKFAGLAAGGNPSILGAIFSQHVHRDTGKVDFEELGRRVASKRAGAAFLGYMQQQMERWLGVRGQKNVKRPELVEAYGFDTKYAAHIIRLGYQGIDYMRRGRFAMPLPDDLAGEIVRLRTGGISEYDAMRWAEQVESDLKLAITESPLPDHPGPIEGWLVTQYERLVWPTDKEEKR